MNPSTPNTSLPEPQGRRPARRVRGAVALAVAACVLGLSGCASMTGLSENLGHQVGIKNDTTAATAGGGFLGALGGCAAGALGGLFAGGGAGAIKGCMAGGVVGGVAGALAARHEQMKEAKALAAETKGTGVRVAVQTSPVASANGASGATGNDERLKALRVTLPDGSLAARDPGVAEAAVKVGKIAALSPNGATVAVGGPAASRDWLISQIKQGASGVADKITFVRGDTHPAQIVVTPTAEA